MKMANLTQVQHVVKDIRWYRAKYLYVGTLDHKHFTAEPKSSTETS